MGKYVKYKRITEIFNSKMLQEKLDSFVIDGWDIIHYTEKILDSNPDAERILVTIVIGKPNLGKQLLLED